MNTDGFLIYLAILIFIFGILLGIGFGSCYTYRIALPVKEAECSTCPGEDRLRCVADTWSSDYIAGRCGEGRRK
jgi:hypothetical protein